MKTITLKLEDNVNDESFFSDSNMRQLDKAIEQVNNGNIVMKSLEELETLANE